jgi:hypothetical protein
MNDTRCEAPEPAPKTHAALTRRGGLIGVGVAVLASAGADAQPASAGVRAEIVAFRKAVTEAIAERNRAWLTDAYTPDYTHVHSLGGVDDRDQRIATFMSGAGRPLETLPVEELRIRTYGRDTAIATGISPSVNLSSDGPMRRIRWTITYVRYGGRWRTAASQTTLLPLP